MDSNQKKKEERTQKKKQEKDPLQESVRRSRSTIRDYVLCNEFDMFVTFTFDPAKVNRYSLESCYGKMRQWLMNNQRRQRLDCGEEFRYIVVPEYHKDGAIHFHALMGGYRGKLRMTSVLQNGKRVYNLTAYRWGFTNMQYLDDDKMKAVGYVCKYITKEMALVGGRRRYWPSKNLQKPEKFINRAHEFGLFGAMNHQAPEYEDDYTQVYNIPKDLFAR